MDFIIDDGKHKDDEVSQAISRIRQESDKFFKKLIDTQIGFNECLTNNPMENNPLSKSHINKHIKLVEEACKFDKGIEALLGCTKDNLENMIEKDLKIENVDDFKK